MTSHRYSSSATCGLSRVWSSGAVGLDIGLQPEVFWLHPRAEMQSYISELAAGLEWARGEADLPSCPFSSSSHGWCPVPPGLLNCEHLTPTILSPLPGRFGSDCDPCLCLSFVLCPSCFSRQPGFPEGSLQGSQSPGTELDT